VSVSIWKPQLKLWTGDLCKAARNVPDCSVDLIFTSPPYKKKDGYSIELMEALGELCGRVLRPGGRAFLNFGQLREGFDRPFEARDLVYEHSNRALEPGQTIAWIKSIAAPDWRELVRDEIKRLRNPAVLGGLGLGTMGLGLGQKVLDAIQKVVDGSGRRVQRGHYQSLGTEKILNYCWEPIFTFYKAPELDLDRRSIGVGFTDKSNMKRGTRGKHGDLHCAGDVWYVPYKTTGKKKKKATAKMGNAYSFPVELPRRAIKMASMARGCVVFDPFLGSGTTAVAAKELGMHAWGIELDKGKRPVIRQRWKEVGNDESKEEAGVDL
jgi:hypothetical protein